MGLWIMRGYAMEARDWCQTILSQVDTLPTVEGEPARRQTMLIANTWNRLSQALMNLGDHQASREAAEASIKLARSVDDQQVLAEGLASLGIGALYSGDPEYALKVTEEGMEICKRMNYLRELAWATNTMIHIYSVMGDKEQERKYKAQYRDILQKAGVETDPVETEMGLAEENLKMENITKAMQHLDTTISILADRGDKYRLMGFQTDFAHILRRQGNIREASAIYQRTILLWQDFGHRAAVAHQLECFGLIAMSQDQPARALNLFAAAEALREISNSVRTPAEQKEFEKAKTTLQSRVEDFDNLWEQGRSMTMEQAVEFAMDVNE